MSISPADLARRLILIESAQRGFRGFLLAAFPKITLASFQDELIEALDALERRSLGKLNVMINMPPRHGKSTITTVGFMAYCMMRDPTISILSVSYGADLASNFGRQVRDLTLTPSLRQAYPDFNFNPTSTAVDDWRTDKGGRYFSCGVGGGTTGRPANVLNIDDPIKSRIEADSASNRNKLWQYYNGSLVNRKEPTISGQPAIELVTNTRWHPDDLSGRIQESRDWQDGDWHHINLSAVRMTRTQTLIVRDLLPPDNPDYLPADQVQKLPPSKRTVFEEKETTLWPERFDMEFMTKMKNRDPREFAALYQQQPYVAGGSMIKTGWFQVYDVVPERLHTVIISADTAFKAKTVSDYSVLILLGMTHDGDILILDVQRVKLDYPSLKRKFITENAKHRNRGLRGIYIEDKASGQSIVQDLRREPGLSVIPYNPGGGRNALDKVARLSTVLPLIEGGRVFLPSTAPWLDDFMEEAQGFPNVRHDDQVDALVIGLDVLSRVPVGNNDVFSAPLNMSSSLNQLQPSKFSSTLNADIDHSRFKPLGDL